MSQLSKKFLAKGKDLFWNFMDLEKAYDRVDRDVLWKGVRLYGVGGKLLKSVQCCYFNSKACVRIGNEVSEWFSANVGVDQCCVMLPWLFNLYMDGLVREVQVRTLGRGAQLVGDGDEKVS